MNFMTMEYFLAVAGSRNITKAAEELHITQQTLSAHIAALEKELDTQLIIRSNPLELTYAGEVFLRHASGIYESYQSMWNEFNDMTGNQRGKLLIGIDYTRSRALMPPVIAAFKKSYPNIEVRLVEGVNRDIHRALISKDIDLAIARFPESMAGVEILPYYREEVVLLVPPQLKNCGIIKSSHYLRDLSEFEHYPFLLGSRNDIAGQVGYSMLENAGFQPIIKAQSNNIETLLALCVQGLGVCIALRSALRAILTDEVLRSMQVFHFTQDNSYPIRFGYRKTSYQWKMISEFIRIALEETEFEFPGNYRF